MPMKIFNFDKKYKKYKRQLIISYVNNAWGPKADCYY